MPFSRLAVIFCAVLLASAVTVWMISLSPYGLALPLIGAMALRLFLQRKRT